MQIPVNSPLITTEDIAAVVAALEDGWISGDGPVVSGFEEAMAASVGRKHAISVSNGTVAIDLAISALTFETGDEIIVPSFTIISVINQILRDGLKPRFVDCDPLTWNMKIDEVEKLINPRTRAIIAVHTYGLPVDMNPLLKIAAEYNLVIIEDASEAHGLRYDEKICGSFGLMSTFSFYANKHITSGEGGMIMTDDDAIAEPQPYVLNFASSIIPSSLTLICNRITSPHAGAPTIPVPTRFISFANTPTFLGFS